MSDMFEPIGPQPEVVAERVAALMVRDAQGRFLCQLRDDLPHVAGAGLWSFFGGRVEAGESLRAAAVREFAEETGIALHEAELRPRAILASSVKPDWLIHIFEVARRIAPSEVCLGEGAGFALLTEAQIKDFEFITTYEQFFEKIFDGKAPVARID